MKKRINIIIATLMIAAIALCGCGGSKSDKKAEGEDGMLTGKHMVEINIKDYGTIKVELDADAAPISVTNFVKLAKEGFFEGSTFHRIIYGFMMQGGDTPAGKAPAANIKGEFAANGVNNPLSHTRGAISMARADDPNSGSSQFFIVHQDSTYLDGQYAAFGYVTEGIEVVDKVCEESRPIDNNGTILPDEQPVIESIKVIE